jgi:hypothetical protein
LIINSNNFWLRSGICELPDVVITLLTTTLLYRALWHPWAALATSLFLFALWTVGTAFNALLAARNEGDFQHKRDWERLVAVATLVQAGITCCYALRVGFASVAVLRLRTNNAMDMRVESVEEGAEIQVKS